MATKQTYLEKRKTGYYWRRRVPAREANRFIPSFFCFPLRTHFWREAAELARRLNAISDLCFHAENDVSPEVMTQILTDYARLEIEAADRLRALTGPRTRQAAESSLALEAAARASLRDAIFLCDKSPALSPIRDTARRLGIPLDESEEDFAVLADKMIRLMIEISEEKERRVRGYFSAPQPYLEMALTPALPSNQPVVPVASAPHSVPARAEPVDMSASTQTPGHDEELDENEATVPTRDQLPDPGETIFYERAGLKIRIDAKAAAPARVLDGEDPTLLDLWDAWFDEKKAGIMVNGAYVHENKGAAERFLRNSDTILSTRRLVEDVFGDELVTRLTSQDWIRFNDMLQKLPNNHGRSSSLRDLSCFEFTDREEKKKEREMRAARKRIEKEGVSGQAKEELLSRATISRISPRTFQRHQKYLSAPLDHAVARGILSHNPFKPFVLGETAIDEMRKGRPETTRQLWTSEDLATLLRTEKWNSTRTQIDDHVYWLPLIARMHGMRSEEILQLKPPNVRCDDGIHFFDIERGSGQSVKSNNARRMIPIHSQLIELGFLELVERQRRLGKSRIFDRVSRSKSKKLSYTANFTKNFNYYRNSRGVYERRRDLHALRTSFNSKMVALAIPDTARRYLMGHRNDDVGIVNYLPEGFPLSTLKAMIEKDRIDIHMVTRRFSEDSKSDSGPRLVAVNGVSMSA